MGDEDSKLPAKVYFRIGEVASLVGVEPHVLRYWEREFRTIRPKKSARGQRVYSRKDVETLMRVRQLLYSEGFTIAGARRRLQQERSGGNGALEPVDSEQIGSAQAAEPIDGIVERAMHEPVHASAERARRELVLRSPRPESPAEVATLGGQESAQNRHAAAATAAERDELEQLVHRSAQAAERAGVEQGALRSTLRELRREIETFLSEL